MAEFKIEKFEHRDYDALEVIISNKDDEGWQYVDTIRHKLQDNDMMSDTFITVILFREK